MSEKDFEKQWKDKALSMTYFGDKVADLTKDQLLIMIGNLLDDIDFKDKLLDHYLKLMEQTNEIISCRRS